MPLPPPLARRSDGRASTRAAWQGPAWAVGAALLVVATLLFAFERVVSQGVQQGAARRAQALALSDDAGCCSRAKGRAAREACLQKLSAQRSAAGAPAPAQPVKRPGDSAVQRCAAMLSAPRPVA